MTIDGFCHLNGGVAQLGERLPCTQEVIGSIPFTSTKQDSLQFSVFSFQYKTVKLNLESLMLIKGFGQQFNVFLDEH